MLIFSFYPIPLFILLFWVSSIFLETTSNPPPGTRKIRRDGGTLVSVENFQANLGAHLVSVKSFEQISNLQWADVIRAERKEKWDVGWGLKVRSNLRGDSR